MRVLHKILTPGVEHGEETDLCAQVLGVDRDRAQRLTRGSEKYIVDVLFVLKGDGRNRLRYCKDHMKIGNRKKLSFDDRRAIGHGPSIGICCNADCGKSYKRCAGGHTDHTARCDRQVLRFDTARSRS